MKRRKIIQQTGQNKFSSRSNMIPRKGNMKGTAIQRKFDRLAGPVSVRKVVDGE